MRLREAHYLHKLLYAFTASVQMWETILEDTVILRLFSPIWVLSDHPKWGNKWPKENQSSALMVLLCILLGRLICFLLTVCCSWGQNSPNSRRAWSTMLSWPLTPWREFSWLSIVAHSVLSFASSGTNVDQTHIPFHVVDITVSSPFSFGSKHCIAIPFPCFLSRTTTKPIHFHMCSSHRNSFLWYS